MAILVYKLTCSVSGKSYVGITARKLDVVTSAADNVRLLQEK
jgi:hypothetical protein